MSMGSAKSWSGARMAAPGDSSIQSPAAGLARYIAQKGSICVDGTSLTVNAVQGAIFELNIVPPPSSRP
jgi:riboflavin synthase alpha subunit